MTSESVLISRATVLTGTARAPALTQADVLICGDRVQDVSTEPLEGVEARRIDGTNRVVMPGLVDTHRHCWLSLAKGLGGLWTLAEYLTFTQLTMAPLFRAEEAYAATFLAAAEALDAGITTLVDWANNLTTPEHADATIQALRDSSIRSVFAYGGQNRGWRDPNVPVDAAEARRLRELYFNSSDALVSMALGARGPEVTTWEHTCAEWRLAKEEGLRLFVHVGTLPGVESVRRLARASLLTSSTTYVHCNTLAADELTLIQQSGAGTSVAPVVERRMGLGASAIARLRRAGAVPGLSVDVEVGAAGDLFEVMRAAVEDLRLSDHEDVPVTVADALAMATSAGARAIGFESGLGTVAKGSPADLVILDASKPGMLPLNDPAAVAILHGHPGVVEHVFVAGKQVKADGCLIDIDTRRLRRLVADAYERLLPATFRKREVTA